MQDDIDGRNECEAHLLKVLSTHKNRTTLRGVKGPMLAAAWHFVRCPIDETLNSWKIWHPFYSGRVRLVPIWPVVQNRKKTFGRLHHLGLNVTCRQLWNAASEIAFKENDV